MGDVSGRISRLVRDGSGPQINVSFEFFPPKTEEMEATLWDSVKRVESPANAPTPPCAVSSKRPR